MRASAGGDRAGGGRARGLGLEGGQRVAEGRQVRVRVAVAAEFEVGVLEAVEPQALVVDPALRGKGIGKALLVHLAHRCVAEELGRFEWWVLDWNEPSIKFYKSQGGVMQDEWTKVRVDGAALVKLGGDS